MSGRDSKSPAISFDSSGSESESDSEEETSQVPNVLTPTPSVQDKLSKANADLESLPSPPRSRASRIGFRNDDDVVEFDENQEPRAASPAFEKVKMTRENNLLAPSPLATESHGPPQKPEVPEKGKRAVELPTDQSKDADEIEKIPSVSSPPKPQNTAVELDTVLVEQNGHISVEPTNDENSEKPSEDFQSFPSSDRRESVKSRDYGGNPDYRSPYALSDTQKKMGRQRQAAKQKRIQAEEELKQQEFEEKQADNEATYKKWLEIKTQERKEKRKAEKQSKANLNSSSVYQNDLNQDERDEIWKEWIHEKDRKRRKERILAHQMEIEKMEGLYVRSRQENDKAFRKWLKAKNRQAREDEIRHWEQVQMSKAELRAIRANQKRSNIINAARVASALEFL